jgi:hypothetical protein
MEYPWDWSLDFGASLELGTWNFLLGFWRDKGPSDLSNIL